MNPGHDRINEQNADEEFPESQMKYSRIPLKNLGRHAPRYNVV